MADPGLASIFYYYRADLNLNLLERFLAKWASESVCVLLSKMNESVSDNWVWLWLEKAVLIWTILDDFGIDILIGPI